MNYLIIASSILTTLLSIISLYFITTTALGMIEEYNDRQELKAKLHPEVTIDDLTEADLLYVTFDTTLTNMIMNNTDAEIQEPISTMLMERYSDDEEDDDE